MNIRTKFAVGLVSVLVVNLGAGLYGLYLFKQASAWETQVREASSQIVSTAFSAQVHFKKQVQEWKNILLRGQNEGLYDKYLRQFEQEETATRAALQQLMSLLAENREARSTAEQFLRAHVRLGREYRSALKFYRPEDSAPQLEVDRRVRGIDREPTDLIDEVVAAALEHKEATLEQIETSIHVVERRIFVLIVGVMTGAVLFLIWLVDRTIGRPIATATAIARRVSAGDFSTPIQVSGADEHAEMLAALKTMQENLAGSQESLRRSEAQTRLLLESTGEGIYGVDTRGLCIFCNPAAARVLGYRRPEELAGRDMHAIMHHSYPDGSPYPKERCKASQTYRNGRPSHVDDEVFWRADGSSFAVEYHSNPIYRDQELAGSVVNFSDITERKRAEAELRSAHDALAQERAHLAQRVRERTAELDRANAELARTAQAKDEFLAAMSHELRTPLTSILGLSETMEDGLLGELSDQQARAVHTIHENGSHLLELINDILDMSRVASGRMNLIWDQVPVNQLWDASLRLIRPSAKAKRLDVSVKVDPEVRLVHGDGRRLKQMLVNLLGNAVKFTPEGGSIGLDVAGDARNRQVRISVWDTGVGIPADQRERLFKPFVQLDSRLSRQYDGTGLGLALAYGMAELHGGGIEVESDVGKGSRFIVSLPWDPDAQTAARILQDEEAPAEAGIPAPALDHPVVLLAEDNGGNLEMLSNYLRIKGCEVLTARNGLEAITVAKERLPDVILMDVQMPKMDGLEATRRLRSDPTLRLTPIIALTALAMPGDRERCLDAGMDDYMSKPLGLKELHRTLTGWIKRTRATRD
jgi:PAS domain S-box-containing protein